MLDALPHYLYILFFGPSKNVNSTCAPFSAKTVQAFLKVICLFGRWLNQVTIESNKHQKRWHMSDVDDHKIFTVFFVNALCQFNFQKCIDMRLDKKKVNSFRRLDILILRYLLFGLLHISVFRCRFGKAGAVWSNSTRSVTEPTKNEMSAMRWSVFFFICHFVSLYFLFVLLLFILFDFVSGAVWCDNIYMFVLLELFVSDRVWCGIFKCLLQVILIR